MGKSSAPKIEVVHYYMSQHFGICVAADAITRVTVKEKIAWEGNVDSLTTISIERDDLFGGVKKEGGVEGTIYFLPGASDQILPDILATRLIAGAVGTDVPGYRGICTAFFTGEGTEHGSGDGGSIISKLGASDNMPGFYWSANSPYLPPVWITVRRAPIGLNPAYALIGSIIDGGTHTVSLPALVHPKDAWFTTLRLHFKWEALDVPATAVRFSFRSGPGEGLQIGECYIGRSVGISGTDQWTFDDTPVQVTWNDGDPGFTIGANTTQMSDWTPLTLNEGDSLLISAHVPNTALNEFDRYINAGAVRWKSASRSDGNFASTISGASFTPHNSHVLFLDDLETGMPGEAGVDANPAHIIYECLTNTDWGMGAPESAIDKAGFEAIAIVLYNDDFGLSMIWTRQASVQKFVQEVLDHIMAVLFVDPATGLLTLKLIRDDYDEGTLPEINPSNGVITSFGRKVWGEIVNEIVVTWTNPTNEQDETVTAQDLASITTQGGIISDSRNYYGVRNADLAARLAARELRASGAPLAAAEVEVDRTFWSLRPASVVKANYPEHGLSGVVMRVTNINYGKPGDPTIKLSLIEDVWGFDAGDYVAPPTTGWQDPSTPPTAADYSEIFTLPLFFAASTNVPAFTETPEYPEVLAGILATTAEGDTTSIELWDEVTLPDGSAEWQQLSVLTVAGRAELAADVPAEATSTIDALNTFTGSTAPVQGGFILIGDGTEEEQEIALITSVGVDVTVDRGVLDTVPRAWPAATPVWFLSPDIALEDPTVRSAGEEVSYKLLPRTSQGLYPLASASLVTYELTERPWLPNRPADVLAYGVAFSSIEAPIDATLRPDPWVTVDWANRNRLLEDSQVLSWTDATVTPETGQTTKIEVLKVDGVTVLDTHDALSGTTFDVPDSSFGSESVVILRTSSERTDDDGTFASLQSFDHFVHVGGGTFRATEANDARATEDGDSRMTEDL